jgi:hypothetical protein
MNNEVTTTWMARLRETVSREPWNLDHVAEWADWFLYWFETDEDEGSEDRWKEAAERQEQQLRQLRPQVGTYRPDPDLPALPDTPDGQPHGVGFVYDEDRDDRVLVAIDTLRDSPGLVAVAEHEGVLATYSRLPVGDASRSVCGDEWVIEEFVPHQGRWTEVTPDFTKDCVARVLGHPSKAWRADPPTARQLAYLRALGHEGPEPKSKGEAGALIAEWKPEKGRA